MSCETCLYDLQDGNSEPCKYCHPTNDKYICKDSVKGRIIVIPVQEDENYDGLKVKYRVYKARNGEPIENCFVLRPDKDRVAREALRAYATATENKALADDIFKWLKTML